MEQTGSDTLVEAETMVGPRRVPASAEPEGLPSHVGHLEIRGFLGEGAVGRVYRAFDHRAGREVAVKKVRQALARDENVMRRFRREAETVERLTHPNLVSVYDVGPDHMVLELVDGESLEERLEREGTLSASETVALLQQMAEALDYIHARGVVHRDVKPSNILVLPDGTVKITDFGIAHLSWAPITRTGELIGSPAYMAPEQIALGDVEPASDVYALGVVAYQCLTGKRPFAGKSIGGLLRSVVYDTAPAATERNASLPAGVDAVLARALDKDPDERHACARDLVAALRDALETTSAGVRARSSWLRSAAAALLAG